MILDLNEILSLMPELMNYAIPGYLFLRIFKYITCMKTDSDGDWLWSVVVSYITIAFVQTAISAVGRYFRPWELVFWCIVVDVLLAVLSALVWKSKWLQDFTKGKLGSTLSDGALQNAIDWKEASYVCVYLKDDDRYYTGNIFMVDENTDGWLTISAPVLRNSDNTILATNADNLNVIMAIPLADIKSIKIIN